MAGDALLDALLAPQQDQAPNIGQTQVPYRPGYVPDRTPPPAPAVEAPLNSRPAPSLGTAVTPPPKPNLGVPMQRADYKGAPIPGTQHEVETPSGYQYENTPYNYEQRLNPMLGLFARSENIKNPALRTLSRIASGIGSVAVGALGGTPGGAQARAERGKEIQAADDEKVKEQESQQRSLQMKGEQQKLGAQDLVKDAQGNVVGYMQGGQVQSMENAPQAIKDVADASKSKGGWNIKDVNIMGPDGKPQTQSIMVNESEMNRLTGTDEFKNAPDKTAYLEANGAIHRMNLGQTAPSGGGNKPMPKMVPTGGGMEQMQDTNPQSATFGQKIGQPQKVGSTKLFQLVDPNDPGNVQWVQQDSKTGATSAVKAPEGTTGMVLPAQAAQSEKKQATFTKNYITPAQAIDKSYDMFQSAYNQRNDAKTGAQSMLALSTHLATTFGNVKGARISKDMIEHHLGARSVSDSALVAVQKLTNGDVLSPDQWDAFRDLISESRNLSWQNVVREADREKQPVNFLPDDLTGVKLPGHQAGVIHSSQLAAFQKDHADAVVLGGR